MMRSISLAVLIGWVCIFLWAWRGLHRLLPALFDHAWRVDPHNSWFKNCALCGARDNTYDY